MSNADDSRAKTQHLVWIDLEMTGLDVETDVIIEIATIITNTNLDVVAESPAMAIHQPEILLEKMDEWNQTQHGASGLLERVRSSDCVIEEAEAVTMDLVSRYCRIHEAPLCGNSIWQDRRFLARYMPKLEYYLHYRIIDVSSIKELARLWHPKVYDATRKKSAHRALDDIKESIDELRHYRREFMKMPTG